VNQIRIRSLKRGAAAPSTACPVWKLAVVRTASDFVGMDPIRSGDCSRLQPAISGKAAPDASTVRAFRRLMNEFDKRVTPYADLDTAL
jgi:hypothetical protein